MNDQLTRSAPPSQPNWTAWGIALACVLLGVLVWRSFDKPKQPAPPRVNYYAPAPVRRFDFDAELERGRQEQFRFEQERFMRDQKRRWQQEDRRRTLDYIDGRLP